MIYAVNAALIAGRCITFNARMRFRRLPVVIGPTDSTLRAVELGVIDGLAMVPVPDADAATIALHLAEQG